MGTVQSVIGERGYWIDYANALVLTDAVTALGANRETRGSWIKPFSSLKLRKLIDYHEPVREAHEEGGLLFGTVGRG